MASPAPGWGLEGGGKECSRSSPPRTISETALQPLGGREGAGTLTGWEGPGSKAWGLQPQIPAWPPEAILDSTNGEGGSGTFAWPLRTAPAESLPPNA